MTDPPHLTRVYDFGLSPTEVAERDARRNRPITRAEIEAMIIDEPEGRAPPVHTAQPRRQGPRER